MGYLTTFTIYNDGIDLIKTESKDFCDKLYREALKSSTEGAHSFGHSGFANLVEVQRSRHADDHTIYVHMGNCVTEMNAYSEECKALMQRNPEFFDSMLKFMDREVKLLKQMKKEAKAKNKDTI